MSNRIFNWARRGIEALLISATLVGSNCVYSTKPKIDYPIEVGNYRFEKKVAL